MDAHRLALEEIANDPTIIGLPEPYELRLEVPVQNRKGRTLTDIDLLLIDEDGLPYIVELKTGKHPKWSRAYRQLSQGARYVSREYGCDPVRMLVHYAQGGYDVEVLP